MKKISTLFLMVIAPFLVSAQSYRPFPESGYFWNERHSFLYQGACGYEYHTCDDPVYFGTDTTINSVDYHRLYFRQICSWISTMGPPIPPCVFAGSYNVGENLFACIRQDTLLKKVFIYDLAALAEVLLYDFNLAPGDTLPPSYSNWFYPNVIVVRVDSLALSDGIHKRYVLNQGTFFGDSIALIEGIGSNIGLLATLIFPFENDDRLICFADTVQTIYPDATASCSIGLGIKPVEVKMSPEVFPNPFQSYLDVRWQNEFKTNLQLYEPDGRLILSSDHYGAEFRMDMPYLSPGVYILKLETAQGAYLKKIIRL